MSTYTTSALTRNVCNVLAEDACFRYIIYYYLFRLYLCDWRWYLRWHLRWYLHLRWYRYVHDESCKHVIIDIVHLESRLGYVRETCLYLTNTCPMKVMK